MKNETPIIDLELGKKVVGNNLELAKELLGILVRSLPEETSSIKQSYDHTISPEFRKKVHKLHGAVCYCGVPRLKKTLGQLETAIKQSDELQVDQLVTQLESEVEILLQHYSQVGASLN